jgi:hypothetical protein
MPTPVQPCPPPPRGQWWQQCRPLESVSINSHCTPLTAPPHHLASPSRGVDGGSALPAGSEPAGLPVTHLTAPCLPTSPYAVVDGGTARPAGMGQRQQQQQQQLLLETAATDSLLRSNMAPSLASVVRNGAGLQFPATTASCKAAATPLSSADFLALYESCVINGIFITSSIGRQEIVLTCSLPIIAATTSAQRLRQCSQATMAAILPLPGASVRMNPVPPPPPAPTPG